MDPERPVAPGSRRGRRSSSSDLHDVSDPPMPAERSEHSRTPSYESQSRAALDELDALLCETTLRTSMSGGPAARPAGVDSSRFRFVAEPTLERRSPRSSTSQENFPRELVEERGYNVETHGQKSFNGVAILSKLPLEDVTRGLPGDDEDEQVPEVTSVAVTW